MVAIAIAIVAPVAAAGFAVMGIRIGRCSRGRTGAALAADALPASPSWASASAGAVAGEQVRRSPPMPPPLRRARPSRFVSARPAAHTPRRLHRAGFPGVDFPIALPRISGYLDALRRFGSTPHASMMQRARACAEPAFSTTWEDFRRRWTPPSCLTESLLRRTARVLQRTVVKPLESWKFFLRGSLENRHGRAEVLQGSVESGPGFPGEPRILAGNSLEQRPSQPVLAAGARQVRLSPAECAGLPASR